MKPLTNEEYEELNEHEKAAYDESIAIKIIGGFGVRVHEGDMNYALKINQLQGELARIPAEEIECMVVLVKVRTIGDKPEDDKFNLVGGTMGSEPELTALHMIIAAKLREFRARIADSLKEEDNEVQAQTDEGKGVPDNERQSNDG